MLFNSIHFAIFLPIVFILYWLLAKKGLKVQNPLLLLSSYFFYACWDWRFLFLLIFSTMLDYVAGQKMFGARNQNMKTCWFGLSISINIAFLGVFKYYNFFTESFTDALSQVGLQTDPWTLNIILPVGISFYTFHGLSYVIDIYKNKIKPERNIIDYAVFVSFFPLLIAGPIERATHLLPQLKKERIFDYENAVDGLRQILWGLFKKVVIADQCAEYANMIFNNSEQYSGSTLLLGALFFTFQIYGDFSGYSDIAIGTSRLFGIKVFRNFAFPYFSRNIAEFWRRWHLSLSSWFRDYVYIPLGGSRGSLLMRTRNILIIFLLTGFWHGASWTFIAWGLLNALYMLPTILLNTNRRYLDTVAQGKMFPTLKELGAMGITFSLVVFAWIFFRAENIHHAIQYVSTIFSRSLFSIPEFSDASQAIITMIFILFFMVVEWIGREEHYALHCLIARWKKPFRWIFYVALMFSIFMFSGKQQEFIYFQF